MRHTAPQIQSADVALFGVIETAALPVMTGYETDLQIDKNWIEAHPGIPFVHFTRATGTHIWALPDQERLGINAEEPYLFGVSTPSEIYKGVAQVMDTGFLSQVVACHVYDGVRLRSCSALEGKTRYCEALRDAQRAVR